MSDGLRIFLIVSAIVISVIALAIFSYLMFKIYKIKKNIKEDRIRIANEISNKEGEKKLVQRNDFGESIFDLKNILPNSIDHECVEVCINSCIRNEFKNALFVGDVGLYELITLSNKANLKSFVEKENWDNQQYQEIKEKISHNHDIEVIDKVETKFDSILILNNPNDSTKLFEDYHSFLKEKGMIIVANIKKNKKETKKLIFKINEFKYKYDMLKWHNGFLIIVK